MPDLDAGHLFWACTVTTFTVLLFYVYNRTPPEDHAWQNALVITAGILGIFLMAWTATAAVQP